jgi:hypothetical protein
MNDYDKGKEELRIWVEIEQEKIDAKYPLSAWDGSMDGMEVVETRELTREFNRRLLELKQKYKILD